MAQKMTENARHRIKSGALQDISALHATAFKSAHRRWREAEKVAVRDYGLEDVAKQLTQLEGEVATLRRKQSVLRAEFPGVDEELTLEDYKLLGLEDEVEVDRWRGDIEVRPKVFEKEIRTKWDGVIYKFLCDQVGLDRIRTVINNAYRAVEWDLDLAGTHEEAQVAYKQLYELVQAGCGDDAPPLLADLRKEIPQMALLAGPPATTKLLEPGDDPLGS